MTEQTTDRAPTADPASTGAAPPVRVSRNPLRSVSAALAWYRVVAWVVGVGLVILVCVGVPLKYLAGVNAVVAVVGPLHGFLYIVYLVLVANLSLQARWWPIRTVLVMLAGTVPFLSFVAERYTTRYVRSKAANS